MTKSAKILHRFSLGLTIPIFLFTWSCSVKNKASGPLTIVSYNVENLFDTIDNPHKNDKDFLPTSPKKWNSTRYEKKINDISKVIYSIDSTSLPILIGLSEVENDVVLKDLSNTERLKKANYGIVWNEGPDIRGIDCAILFDQNRFKLVSSKFIPVFDPDNKRFKTREIVYASGEIGKELFHVFVSHWPSRIGGEKKTEAKRIITAKILRAQIDSIYNEEKAPNIVIMGDFNDEPTDTCIISILGARPNDQRPDKGSLVNLMYDEQMRGEGSYNYLGNWDMLDNLIVSENLIYKKKGLKTTLDDGHIFHLPFMEFKNSKGRMSPDRTYGSSYFGGISDHFPIYISLE